MKYIPINKQLMLVDDGGSYKRVLPNIFEAVKAECIADAKGLLLKHLPYVRMNCVGFDLADWRRAFSSDNPPEKVKFDGRLEEMLRDVDFSKPFNAGVAEKIRSEFVVKTRVRADVDADLIIQGELGELDEAHKA